MVRETSPNTEKVPNVRVSVIDDMFVNYLEQVN